MAQKRRSQSSRSSTRRSSSSARKRGVRRSAGTTSSATPGSRRPSGGSPSTAIGRVLEAIDKMAGALQARWYLFGAQAVAIWGRPRSTADVDVTIEAGSGTRIDDVILAARRAGLRLRAADAKTLAQESAVLLLECGGIPVDVVLGGPGLEALFLSRARRVRLGRLTIPVIGPEDLIVTKLIAGRPRDLEDVRGILSERAAELDLDQLRGLLSEIGTVLERSDLIDTLDRLEREAGLLRR